MNLSGANETDVREEIATPLLAALGYQRGTANDIAREQPLSYSRKFLGRKKATDPPLRGRADYILSVIGVARWVLEVKAPNEDIDADAIDQALSYARHPEVSAFYAVVLNGRRLTVHRMSQWPTDPPLADLEVTDPQELASRLQSLLSPAAIRRDCSPPMVDLAQPLAEGLRSYAAVCGGQIQHRDFKFAINTSLPPQQLAQLNEMGRRLNGLIVAVTGGVVRRDENSRIRAKLAWSAPHDALVQFALDKKLMDVEFIALAEQISVDPEHPTVFDMISEVAVAPGDVMFDIVRWQTQTAGIAMHMQYQSQATGFIADGAFKGTYDARYVSSFPLLPGVRMEMELGGDFNVLIDYR
jgi:Type I restriction enzyme R protein N terminus (HSDR_N)